MLSTIPIVLWAGSLSLVTIFDSQLEFGWFIFSPPGLLAFVILLIASIAEVNRTPFDLPEAESEIIAGYHTEYSSMRFGLFFLAEYLSVFAVSCLEYRLVPGGGTRDPVLAFPTNLLGDTWFSYLLVDSILVAVFLGKVLFFIFLMFWVRATLPRMRVDRLMNFAWKYLVPLCIVNILVAAIWYELVIRRPGRLAYWSLGDWAVGTLVTLRGRRGDRGGLPVEPSHGDPQPARDRVALGGPGPSGIRGSLLGRLTFRIEPCVTGSSRDRRHQ